MQKVDNNFTMRDGERGVYICSKQGPELNKANESEVTDMTDVI